MSIHLQKQLLQPIRIWIKINRKYIDLVVDIFFLQIIYNCKRDGLYYIKIVTDKKTCNYYNGKQIKIGKFWKIPY